jgi:hypothetical protein
MAQVGQKKKYLNCVRRNPPKPFIKNGPVIFSIKSLVFKPSTSPWPPLEAQILRTGREKVYSHMLKKFNHRCQSSAKSRLKGTVS